MTSLRDSGTAPGSRGNETAACFSCLRPTGLRAAFEGEARWNAAHLARLGTSREQAEATVSGHAGGPVPDGRVTTLFPLCDWCAPVLGFRTVLCIEGLDVHPVRQSEGGPP
jgi:hypothetical protein